MNFTSFKLICLPIFFERLLLLNGVTGLAKNSVSKETGNGYIKEGSGKMERPPATILLQAAYGLLNSYQGRQGKTETTDTEPGLMRDHRIETLWSLLPTRFIPVYRSNYNKLTSCHGDMLDKRVVWSIALSDVGCVVAVVTVGVPKAGIVLK
ncbi:hypothetical protein V6N11_017632 [Hibiscus sabdariffa]|uniref:Uncharacterized protein n=1 Tax=Hibiscus sabdariffa TaxID=183260 RepID=A0ABR2TZC1_9ROSI